MPLRHRVLCSPSPNKRGRELPWCDKSLIGRVCDYVLPFRLYRSNLLLQAAALCCSFPFHCWHGGKLFVSVRSGCRRKACRRSAAHRVAGDQTRVRIRSQAAWHASEGVVTYFTTAVRYARHFHVNEWLFSAVTALQAPRQSHFDRCGNRPGKCRRHSLGNGLQARSCD